MKVALLGANGQLGSAIERVFSAAGTAVIALNHDVVDIADAGQVAEILRDIAPGVVINTAAYHHLERCEENPDIAFAVNAFGARNIARAAGRAFLVHVSTDYVFDGVKGKPYIESDVARPLNVYGNSKLSGEMFVLSESENRAVLRVAGLYGLDACRAKGLNFVDLMLKLGNERDEVRVVDDEVLTPTFVDEVARQVAVVVAERMQGLAHSTAEGACSWHRFAAEIFEIAGLPSRLSVTGPGEFPAKVPRPAYSVLENTRVNEMGINVLRDWRFGLKEYLAERLRRV